jgi:hypothetical protein
MGEEYVVIGKVSSLLGSFREGYMSSDALDVNFHHTSFEGSKFNFHVGGVYQITSENQEKISGRLMKLPEIEKGYYVFVSGHYEIMCHLTKKKDCLCFDTFKTVDIDSDTPDRIKGFGEDLGQVIHALVEYFVSED